jgi:hypothetical protein
MTFSITARFNALLAASCAALLLTACGGGPPPGLEDYQPKTNSAPLLGRNIPPPDHTFGNFNPEIWNNNTWYECNCGRDPTKPDAIAPFDETGQPIPN